MHHTTATAAALLILHLKSLTLIQQRASPQLTSEDNRLPRVFLQTFQNTCSGSTAALCQTASTRAQHQTSTSPTRCSPAALFLQTCAAQSCRPHAPMTKSATMPLLVGRSPQVGLFCLNLQQQDCAACVQLWHTCVLQHALAGQDAPVLGSCFWV
jgi:hypothetical protein